MLNEIQFQQMLNFGGTINLKGGKYEIMLTKPLIITQRGTSITGGDGLLAHLSFTFHHDYFNNGYNGTIFTLSSRVFVDDLTFKNFYITTYANDQHQKAKMNGAVFYLQGTTATTFSRVFIDTSDSWDGIFVNHFGNLKIQGCRIKTRHNGIMLAHGTDAYIDQGNQISVQNYGMQLGADCGGIQIAANDIIECRVGIALNLALWDGSGHEGGHGVNREVFIGSQCMIDRCGIGIEFEANSIKHFNAVGCWIGSCRTAVNIKPEQEIHAPIIKFLGCYITQSHENAIEVSGGQIVITGCVIHYSGYPDKESRAGIVLHPQLGIIGASLSNNTISGLSSKKCIGIYIAEGVKNYLIIGNHLTGNYLSILDKGQAPKLISDNFCYTQSSVTHFSDALIEDRDTPHVNLLATSMSQALSVEHDLDTSIELDAPSADAARCAR